MSTNSLDMTRIASSGMALLGILSWSAAFAAAQQFDDPEEVVAPWVTFSDLDSTSICDVINAEDAELVLLESTGELVIITGEDEVLEGTFVNLDNDVFFDGVPTGFLTFDTDAEGFRTLWWVSSEGRVINTGGPGGIPVEIDAFPSDFENVPCDACDFWDDADLCASLNQNPEFPQLNLDFCGLNSGVTMGMMGLGMLLAGYHRRRRAG
ncbi:MAG: hypothetical protein ACYTHJ_04600 [Planctomycetota bacterium]|jgi:hypothetical protein